MKNNKYYKLLKEAFDSIDSEFYPETYEILDLKGRLRDEREGSPFHAFEKKTYCR